MFGFFGRGEKLKDEARTKVAPELLMSVFDSFMIKYGEDPNSFPKSTFARLDIEIKNSIRTAFASSYTSFSQASVFLKHMHCGSDGLYPFGFNIDRTGFPFQKLTSNQVVMIMANVDPPYNTIDGKTESNSIIGFFGVKGKELFYLSSAGGGRFSKEFAHSRSGYDYMIKSSGEKNIFWWLKDDDGGEVDETNSRVLSSVRLYVFEVGGDGARSGVEKHARFSMQSSRL
ncbi:MAG: hypothetical protein WCJ19_00105 [bacterium]